MVFSVQFKKSYLLLDVQLSLQANVCKLLITIMYCSAVISSLGPSYLNSVLNVEFCKPNKVISIGKFHYNGVTYYLTDRLGSSLEFVEFS